MGSDNPDVTQTTAPSGETNTVAEETEKSKESQQAQDQQNKAVESLPTVAFQYRQVDDMLKEAFNYKESNNSMICDIIAMYLKGQKILYTEAKTLCEQRLNYLMLPTICITAICAVISVVLKDYGYSSTIVSSLNGLNFFFLTLINYLKLDAKAEAHRVAAYKFDKIQSKLEFNSGKILFIVGAAKALPELINETEKDVRDIKETNQFILPESIRYNYPKLNNINVFAEVKKIQSKETLLTNNLKDTLNEHVNLNIKIRSAMATVGTKSHGEDLKELARLEFVKKMLTDQIIGIKDEYLEIDNQFEDEMETQRSKLSKRFQLCGCLKT